MDTTPMILTGPPGCGKSYWIQKYAEEIQKQLFVCPCRKDRTLRDGRQKLHIWARRTEPAILWLEGADDLTPEAQAFLRRILETHASDVLFILECRDAGRLQEPIRSRCRIKKMVLPKRVQLESYLKSAFHGVRSGEILDHLELDEYSYRRAKQCAYLQQHVPEEWKSVQLHRIKQQKEQSQLSSSKILHYIQEAYHPEEFLYSMVCNETVLKDYGDCMECDGSLWALLAYTLERRAFDTDSTTPHKKEE